MASVTARLETPGAKLERDARPELKERAADPEAAKAADAAKSEFAPKRRAAADAVLAKFERSGFDDGNQKFKQPPRDKEGKLLVEVLPNTTGEGGWIEKWRHPKTGEWIHNYTLAEMRLRAGEKFVENKLFGDKLPAIRAQVDADLEGEPPRRLWATVVRLIDATFIRVGNEDSAEQGHYGATTLPPEAVTIEGNDVTVDFIGKMGKQNKQTVTDEVLARELAALKERATPGQPLFQWNGKPITADQINDYLEPFGATAKNFRTYHATRLAREYLLAHPAEPEKRVAVAKEMFKVNALRLGHTPAVDRDSYVDPMVVKSYLNGTLQ